MVHFYTYEYGLVTKSEALHVYCSKDRAIGLAVRAVKRDGTWQPGYSRFFLWEEGPAGAEYDSERDARRAAERLPLAVPLPANDWTQAVEGPQ